MPETPRTGSYVTMPDGRLDVFTVNSPDMQPNPMPACDLPPRGWWCSRPADHEGSCAAHPRWWNLRWQLRAVQYGSRVNIDKAALWLCGAMLVAVGLLFGFIIGVLAA